MIVRHEMLISVKNPTEAIIAAKHPLVSIVDLKDPDSGPLGFAGASAVAEVALAVSRCHCDASEKPKPFSIACGELNQWVCDGTGASPRWSMDLLAELPWPSIDFVKVGLSDSSLDQWPLEGATEEPRSRFFSHVPTAVSQVLVIYADVFDIDQAKALLDAAMGNTDLNPTVLLLDTFDKTRGSIFSHYSPDDCRNLFDAARNRNLKTVLAGSIDLINLERADETNADLIGARGAVCALRSDYTGTNSKNAASVRKNAICADRMHQFLTAAKTVTPP